MVKLKPQDFPGLTDRNITISAAPQQIIESIKSRKDLSLSLANYLVKLVEYSSGARTSTVEDLKKFYSKINTTDKNAIQKDFSELLAPIILLKEAKQNISKFKNLNLTLSSASKMFIPAAGNYPLIDFMIVTGQTRNEYSVKTLQKTTNTLKAGDILKTVSSETLRKYSRETTILQLINKYDAKLGPILILSKLAPTMSQFKKNHKLYRTFTSLTTANNNIFASNPIDWYDFFEPIVDAYYLNGKSTFNKAWKAKFYYDALSVLAQYTVADVTQNLKWKPLVDDVRRKVTYFKFGLNTNGSYMYEIINGLSEQKPNQTFKLRAKSRLAEGAWAKRSGQDKLGIQA